MKLFIEDEDGNEREITMAEYNAMSPEEFLGRLIIKLGPEDVVPISVVASDSPELKYSQE